MNFLKSAKNRFFILVLLCSIFFSIKIYRNAQPPVTGWDVFGYYLYLPQAVIHKDVKLQNTDHLQEIYKKYNLPGTLYQINKLENGNHAIKYTTGWAILNFPFFIGGHIYAKSFGYETDGFSTPYQWSVVIACIFYAFLGMFLTGILLLRFFSVTVSAWVFLLLVFGTNYYFIIVDSFTMPHLHLFTLYAAFLLVTDNWHRNKSWFNSILLGGILALMTLVRPTEILAALIPFLWGILSWNDLKERFKMVFTTDLLKMVVIVFSFVIVCLPQLYYWKTVSGKILYYGYDNAGEGFEFLQPNLGKVLFGFRKGFFIYTPLALFFITGFFFMRKHVSFFALLIFYLFNVYVISCWTNWWYAESFSQRPLMHSLPVLIIPFGFLVKELIVKKRDWFFGIFLVLTFLNIFQTWQASVGIIHGSRMTFDYYCAVFMHTEIPPGAEKLLLVDRSAAAENGFDKNEYHLTQTFLYDFEKTKSDLITSELAFKGKKSFEITPENPFSYAFEMEFKDITQQDHAWIKVSMWIYLPDSLHILLPSLITTFEHDAKPYMYQGLNFESDTTRVFPMNKWFKAETYYLTPELRTKSDKFKAYLWMRGQGKMYVDNMKVEFYEHN
jgi:hypothetical protein